MRFPDLLQRVRLADLAIDAAPTGSDGARRSWIMLFPVGTYEHESYGELNFTRARLLNIKALYDKRVRHIDAALDVDHRAKEDDSRATGWIERLELREAAPDGAYPAGLWGEIKWTPYGIQLLRDDEYRYFSPEFGPWKDPQTGADYTDVLMGGALTNRPFLKTMPAIMLAELADAAVSRRPWGSVNKSRLPAACFLIVGDPAKKSTWRLPVYESADGVTRGALNLNAVKAAYTDLRGGHGQTMQGVPASVRAKVNRWHAQYFGDDGATAASERSARPASRSGNGMTTRSKDRRMDALDRLMAHATGKGANGAERPLADPEVDDTTALADNAKNSGDTDGDTDGDSEDLDELDELTDLDELDELAEDDEEPATVDAGSSSYADADGDDDGDTDAGFDSASDTHGAMTTTGHRHGKFGKHSHDGDGSHSDAPLAKGAAMSERRRGGRASHRVGTGATEGAAQMSLREVQAMREENERLRFALYERRVKDRLAKWRRGSFELRENAKAAPRSAPITLSKAFTDSYQALMLSEGLRLSEDSRARLDAVIGMALSNAVVDLSARSSGSYDPDGQMVGRSAAKRYSLDESDRVERQAERIALAETSMTTEQLAQRDPAKLLAIYERAQAHVTAR